MNQVCLNGSKIHGHRMDYCFPDLAYSFSVSLDLHLYHPNAHVLVGNVFISQSEYTKYIISGLLR